MDSSTSSRGSHLRGRGGLEQLCQTPPFLAPALQCRFAVVQYGEVIQTELDLLDSQDVRASLDRVKNISQVGKITKTASAMQHVL